MRQFELKEEHLKLVRRMYVGWQDCEFGAPEIDPKRPYGNSDVIGDIHEILGGNIEYDRHGEIIITQEQEDYYTRLHHETETALQILINAGNVEPGTYVADNYNANWGRVNDTIS